ncbi:MaoC family dehydratase [Sphingopyxis sp. H115]|uniref:MaoC family dehydratase n=1 Tax=Sphingopyxis sp. H115 TaxID=1759073 RepID=UPI0007376A4D|nr:MaoC family dehydratase [Sphingopyxis sp. H115]KTE16559.1 dehydratase [Sphingopyxis sp. H115]
MSTRIFDTPTALLAAVGERFGPTAWVGIEQDRIDLFAKATDDHQWIHVDPERAKDGPFGGTIAHGYLTMSLVNRFLPELVEVRGVSMGINIGTDNLRFLNPVRAGSRIRGVGELVKAEEAKGGVQAVVRVTVEIEGAEKPACVVDTISRFYPKN